MRSLFFAAILVAGWSPAITYAQDPEEEQDGEAAEQPEEPPDPEPIAAPAIGRRIEETFRELQALAPRLRRNSEVRSIERQLDGFREEIARARERPELEELDELSAPALMDVEHSWSLISARLESWQATLETRGGELDEEREHVARARLEWEITESAERDDPLPESQQQRIRSLLERIDNVAERIQRRLDEVLAIQGQLSDQGIRVAATMARVAAARQRVREDRRERDHEPLWRGGDALTDARPEQSPTSAWQHLVLSVRRFLIRERTALIGHACIGVFFALLFLVARRRFGVRPAVQGPVRAFRAILARPLAAAALLTLAIGIAFYQRIPFAVGIFATVGVAAATVRLGRFVGPERELRANASLLAVCAIGAMFSLGLASPPIRRLGLLALTVASAGLAGWIGRPRFDDNETAPSRSVPTNVARLAFVLWLASTYLNSVGSVEWAGTVALGTWVLFIMAVAVPIGVELTLGVVSGLARTRALASLRTLSHHRRATVQNLRTVLRIGGTLLIVYFALAAYDLLDELVTEAELFMRRTYEFGAIEVSLSDLAGFLGVIVCTIVVVRLVHFLLAEELLPRVGLGKGTESAISLTVSYILFAAGFVLAFGAAGVEPERLALLGGALGVGIGFGLQNVVHNFVSGLILVAERPIQVGDVIELGTLVGEVTRIGVRSSTVRSLDGAEVIVPNADLISSQLVNWTLSDHRRRIELVVGTGYQHPPKEIVEILRTTVASQPGVLPDPEPSVICVGFGESSVDFSIRAWTADFSSALEVRSQLAQRVYDVLEDKGIEIPFPKRDVRILSDVDETPDVGESAQPDAA